MFTRDVIVLLIAVDAASFHFPRIGTDRQYAHKLIFKLFKIIFIDLSTLFSREKYFLRGGGRAGIAQSV
jgi:uncharacterized membrane protein YtjA (UPF0391 family)